MTANNFHEHRVAKAQECWRTARAAYADFAASMDWFDRGAEQHLAKLDSAMREAEDKLNDAQHALRGFEAMCRQVADEAT